MAFTDNNILAELLVEAKDHLANIEPNLLVLEKQGKDTQPEVINLIFRAAHSLKGSFGFFGYTNIQQLSHQIENVLMLIRDGRVEANQDIMDALLMGIDKLRMLIENVRTSESISIEKEVKSLSRFLEKDGDPPEKRGPIMVDSVPVAQTRVNRGPVNPGIDKGMYLYTLTLSYQQQLFAYGRSFRALCNAIGEIGKLLVLDPEPSNPGDLEEWAEKQESVAITFGSILEESLLSRFLEIPENQIRMIKQTESVPAPQGIVAGPQTPTMSQASVHGVEKTMPENAVAENRIQSAEAIRVRINLLNKLMNLAGELVLGRNQIRQKLETRIADLYSSSIFSVGLKAALESTRQRVREAFANDPRFQDGNLSEDPIYSTTAHEIDQLLAKFNQALEFSLLDMPGVALIMHHIDFVTSEIQQNIMQTRLQQVGTVFSKFPRLIRDISKKLGKAIDLSMEGEDVELDRSIVENLGDPLTHLIRNCADHGIESPSVRRSAGKNPLGKVVLKAYHEGGQVNIDIIDDGAGIDSAKLKKKAIEKGLLSEEKAAQLSENEAFALIFYPGVSTAEQVTQLSGRGVGMDVVKTNIEKLGGSVVIESALQKGTRINLKLPLTVAIMPSLFVALENRTFAIPQVNIKELVRLRAEDAFTRIETIQGKPILRLREQLLPLVFLSEVLGLEKTFVDATGRRRPDRRLQIFDRRKKQLCQHGYLAKSHNSAADLTIPAEPQNTPADEDQHAERRAAPRRKDWKTALKIVVLKVGPHRFGLIVERLLNHEEIVVNPLSSYLKACRYYSGTTIMGDGQIAMILDANGIAATAGLQFGGILEKECALFSDEYRRTALKESQSLLLFRNNTEELFAINLRQVARVERVHISKVTQVGDMEFLKQDHFSLRLIRLHDYMPIRQPEDFPEVFYVVVPKFVANPVGIIISKPVDIIEAQVALDRHNLSGPGILGIFVHNNDLLLVIDIYRLLESIEPERALKQDQRNILAGKRILLAEDTEYLETVERDYLECLGCVVDSVKDGNAAWDKLRNATYDLLVTDTAMPGLNGLELTKRIRESPELNRLPIMTVSSMINQSERDQFLAAGANGYELKLDRDTLHQTLIRIVAPSGYSQ